jgi:membrane protein implicated in regulation of membrane protease activity
VAVIWLVVGVALLAVELHHLAFYALFGAVAAFAAALVAAFAPSAVVAQLVVAVVVTAVGVAAVRPRVSRAFAHRHEGNVARGVHGGLVGAEAVTLDEVGDEHRAGHVRLAGERWLAVSGSGTALPPGTVVTVTGVRGTTLLVWPLRGPVGLAAWPDHEPGLGNRSTPPDISAAPDGAEGATS